MKVNISDIICAAISKFLRLFVSLRAILREDIIMRRNSTDNLNSKNWFKRLKAGILVAVMLLSFVGSINLSNKEVLAAMAIETEGPVIMFPTKDNLNKPAGYSKVEFLGSNDLAELKFTGLKGEVVEGTTKKVVFWVKNGVKWGEFIAHSDFRWPEVTLDDGDMLLNWAYGGDYQDGKAAFDLDAVKDQDVRDSSLAPVVDYIVDWFNDNQTFENFRSKYAAKDLENFKFIVFDANGGTYGTKATRTMYITKSDVTYDNPYYTEKFKRFGNPVYDKHTFVRWQTDAGDVMPKTGKIAEGTTTYKALYIKHLANTLEVWNPDKLTKEEKEAIKRFILDTNSDTSKFIEEIEVSDSGEAVVKYKGGESVTLDKALLVTPMKDEDKAQIKNDAKKEIDLALEEKKEEISKNDKLTNEEKDNLKAKAEEEANKAKEAIDKAENETEVENKKEDGIKAIKSVDLIATEKDKAKAEVEEALKQKLAEIEKNNELTSEEKKPLAEKANQEAIKAKEAIDKALNQADVDKIKEEGIRDIKNISVEVKSDTDKTSKGDKTSKASNTTNVPKTGDRQGGMIVLFGLSLLVSIFGLFISRRYKMEK